MAFGGYNPYIQQPEKNDRGDSYNGSVGTNQPASVQNRSAQPSQAAPARGGGGNPYLDAVSGAANPQIGPGFQPAPPRPQPGPQWNDTVRQMLPGAPGVAPPQEEPAGRGRLAGRSPDTGFPEDVQTGLVLPGGTTQQPYPDMVQQGIDLKTWGPSDPRYDANNPNHVAMYYQRYNPAVTSQDVTNYREWAFDPNVDEAVRAQRQATHFNDWWSGGKPIKNPDDMVTRIGNKPPGGAGRGGNRPGGNRGGGGGGRGSAGLPGGEGNNSGGGGGGGSASGSVTPGTGTPPGDSNDYLRRLEATVRNQFQATRGENLDQFRHQGGVNNLSRYGAAPEVLGEMYQAMARDENSALMNPLLGVAENEQNRILQKYGIDVGADTTRYSADKQAAAARANANAAYRSQMANLDWQREKFSQEFPFSQEQFRTGADQDLMDSYLDYQKFQQSQLPVWIQLLGENGADALLRNFGLPTGGMY